MSVVSPGRPPPPRRGRCRGRPAAGRGRPSPRRPRPKPAPTSRVPRRGSGCPRTVAAPRPAGRPSSPASTIRPWSMMTTSSHRSSTRSSWWLENSTVAPAGGELGEQLGHAPMAIGSRPENGSSSTSRSGSLTRAAISWTRCWLPCDERVEAVAGPVGEAEPLEPGVDAAADVVARPPAELAEVHELVAHPHAGVQAPLLRHVASRIQAPSFSSASRVPSTRARTFSNATSLEVDVSSANGEKPQSSVVPRWVRGCTRPPPRSGP